MDTKEFSLPSLHTKLHQLFGIPAEANFVVQYRDQDKDWVTLSSDEEATEALNAETENAPLRVRLISGRGRNFKQCWAKGLGSFAALFIGLNLFWPLPCCFKVILALVGLFLIARKVWYRRMAHQGNWQPLCRWYCGKRENRPGQRNTCQQSQQQQQDSGRDQWENLKENIAKLEEIGWDKSKAIQALVEAKGDLVSAVQLLVVQ